MVSPLLARVLVALAAPALAVSALAVPAGAAPAKGPDTPTVAQVATVYPQLAETTATTESIPVKTPLEDCSDGKRVPGSRGTTTSYDADPSETSVFGAEPWVLVAAFSFRSAADASAYLQDVAVLLPTCAGLGEDEGTTLEEVRFGLGDERVGYVATTKVMRQKIVTQQLMVRSGRTVVFANVLSSTRKAPALRKAIRLTALALKSAR